MTVFKKNYLLIIFVYILTNVTPNILYAADEAFLTKNTSSMTNVSPHQFTLSDDQFNTIFPKVFMQSFNSKAEKSVGQIRINLGPSIKSGTGTIIGWDNSHIKVITAKHVVQQEANNNKGIQENIEFYLGQSAVANNNANISNYATFSENPMHRARIFFHNNLDVAYILFPVGGPHNLIIQEATIKENIITIEHGNINRGKVRHLYHYPWGKQELRYNKGPIKSDKQTVAEKKYEVTTLPGSSGAPVVVDNNLIGIHIQEGDTSADTVTYATKALTLTNNNIYVSMHHINNDYSDFHEVQRN